MLTISENLSNLPGSGIRMIMNKASQLKKCYHMEIGDPGFHTPVHIQEAAIRAIQEGKSHYTPSVGIPSLREAILTKVQKENKITARYEQVGVTSGAVFALAATIMSISEQGDEILIPDPGFPNYYTQSLLLNRKPVFYNLSPDTKYQPDIEKIKHQITSRTRAIIINSPANPTGIIFRRNVMESLLELCDHHDLYLISDEVYERIIYKGEHFSPASLDPNGRVITIFSVSKTYAMTGWRIGYFAAPETVAECIGKTMECYQSCPSSISQFAAQVALTGSQDCVDQMVESYTERRNICVDALNNTGLKYVLPDGAFYLQVGIEETGLCSYDFTIKLLEATGVATTPGRTFGPNSDKYIRISFCTNKEDVKEGICRIIKFYDDHKNIR
jgi:aspartate/methionine/tyrosine aminotransferase